MLEDCFYYRSYELIYHFICKMLMLIRILFMQMSNAEEKESLWLKMVFVENKGKEC